jgi:hypothetical protein
MDAKVTSTNYKKFFERYGSNRVVELDAAPVVLLQEKLKDAIESVIDMNEFNSQLQIQDQEAVELYAHRTVVFETMGKVHK